MTITPINSLDDIVNELTKHNINYGRYRIFVEPEGIDIYFEKHENLMRCMLPITNSWIYFNGIEIRELYLEYKLDLYLNDIQTASIGKLKPYD